MTNDAGTVGAPYANPLLPGFHPDPSVVAVDGAYYIVTSTFEYLPGRGATAPSSRASRASIPTWRGMPRARRT